MDIFNIEEYVKMENPNSGARYRQNIITNQPDIESLGGSFAILPPGEQVPYHLHNKRETIIIAISGEATEIIEGKEYPFKTNDVFYIPAGEKHGLINSTNRDFRYIEFFTRIPGLDDRVLVKSE